MYKKWHSKKQSAKYFAGCFLGRIIPVCPEAGVGEAKRRDRETESRHQMEWVRQMNACKAQAEEIVKIELIYD